MAAARLQKWGRDNLIADLREKETLQERFRACAIDTAKPRKSLPPSMGAGVIDAKKLIETPPWKASFPLFREPEPDQILGESAHEILIELDTNILQSQDVQPGDLLNPEHIDSVANEIIWRCFLYEKNVNQPDWDVDNLPPLSTKLSKLADSIPELQKFLP